MKPRRRALPIAVGLAALALVAAACSSGSGSGSSNGKITITEFDYFTSGGSNTAVNWYNKKFEAAHPNVTVKREVVPFANLITKVLQDASAQDMPSIVMLDNPNIPQVAATGQLRPFNNLPGFTTQGYYAGSMNECKFKGSYYCYPIGTNSLGIFYNKKMLADAHLQPPTTWAELESDAKKLTKSGVYGFAFDATADEQSTWQLEPFFWTNGGSLSNVDTPAVEQSLQLWVNMVKNGSASKSVLTWGQDPDLNRQFEQGKAAMIEDGPWIFPELNASGMQYGKQFGIVPIPTRQAGQTVVAPLGGETWTLGAGGSDEQQKMAWAWIKGMQVPSTMTHVTSLMYYLPTKPAVTAEVLKGGPEYTVFAKETLTARGRTTEYGANYPKVSQAIWTAIQAAISGSSSVDSALQQAQSTISGIPKVSGGG